MTQKKIRISTVISTCLFCAQLSYTAFAQWDMTSRELTGSTDSQTTNGRTNVDDESNRSYPLGQSFLNNYNSGTNVEAGVNDESSAFTQITQNICDNFTNSYAEYCKALDSSDCNCKETHSLVVKLLTNTTLNLRANPYLATLDVNTSKLNRVRDETLFVKDDYVGYEITSESDGYLYLFYQNSDGDLSLLYPSDVFNRRGALIRKIENFDTTIMKNQKIILPESGFSIKASAPYGTEYLFAVVTNYRLKASELRNLFLTESAAKPKDSSSFATFCQYLLTGDRKLVEYPVTRGIEPPFRYGACRIAMGVFETQAAKDKYLSNPQTYFVGIGIDKYACSAITPLPSCVNDVTRMAETLQAQGAITKSNTLLLTNEDASAERIKFLFSSFLPTRLRPCDRLIVHWSSHGATISDKMCFVPYDAEVSVENEKMSASGMITSDALNQWSYLLPGREIFYILDCCYSGAAIDKSFNWVDVSMQKSLSGNNIAIMASSSDEEVSLVDRDTKQFSIMSKKAIDYLAANRNVDAQKLFKAIESDVNETANSQFQKEQHVWWASGLKEFIINPDSSAQGQSQAQAQESDAAQTSGQNQQ